MTIRKYAQYAKAEGRTITEMRANIPISLRESGDTILIWINEGDLYCLANATNCPNCSFWKSERDKAVAHAMEYGPRMADLIDALQKYAADWHERMGTNKPVLDAIEEITRLVRWRENFRAEK